MTTRSTLISAAISTQSARKELISVRNGIPAAHSCLSPCAAVLERQGFAAAQPEKAASVQRKGAAAVSSFVTAGFGIKATLPAASLPQLDAQSREISSAPAQIHRSCGADQCCEPGLRQRSIPVGAGDPVTSDPGKPSAAQSTDELISEGILPGISWAGADGGCAGKRSHTRAWEQALAEFVANDAQSPTCSTVVDDSPAPAGAAGLISHGRHSALTGADTQPAGWRRFCNPEVRGSNLFHAPYGPAHRLMSSAAASRSLSAPSRARRTVSAAADC